MSHSKKSKTTNRARRHARVRARISGTAVRPRLHVSRSLRGMYVQLIDDVAGRTLVSVNSKSNEKGQTAANERTGKVAVAYALGLALAHKSKAGKIERVVFDRAGHKYHGRVKAVADGARDGGLKF